MLIYDRDDVELAQPVQQEMSAEVKESWGSLIGENQEATAKALVCNLNHLQLLLDLMDSAKEAEIELVEPLLQMVIPFFLQVVVRLGKEKENHYKSYSSGSYYNYGSSSYSSTSYNNDPPEAEEDEDLDDLLWQWGYMVGTLARKLSQGEIKALLAEYQEELASVMLSCPRTMTGKSVSRMLLRLADFGPEQVVFRSRMSERMNELVNETQ